MRTRIIAVVIAAVLAIVGGLVLVNYVRGADARAFSGTQLQKIYVVTKPIAAGTEAGDLGDSVAVASVAKAYVVDGAVVDLSAIDGLVTSDALVPGEQVLASRFIEPNEFAANEGSIDVPAGLDELSFAVDAQRVLGGLVSPGEKVSILASFSANASDPTSKNETVQLLTQVLVTSVKNDFTVADAAADVASTSAGSSASTTGTVLVTVAVSADDAAKLAYSKEFGQVWVSRLTDASTKPTEKILTLEELTK